MPVTFLPDLRLNAEIHGPADAPAVVLLHALGLDLAVWDAVLPPLDGLRVLRLDMRGHGRSDVPDPPYTMGALIHDAERMIDAHGLREAVVVGLSIGGLIAQGLAVKRLDLVRGLVLSNTAAKIGIASQWEARIEAVKQGGLESIADGTMERWFGRNWRALPQMPQWRARLLASNPQGWIGAAHAIAGTDFYTPTAGLRLPTLAIAGANDGATPPDLVRETADLIAGSRFALLRGAGHLPMVEKPAEYGAVIRAFLDSIGHG